jgi:hypothetical protein
MLSSLSLALASPISSLTEEGLLALEIIADSNKNLTMQLIDLENLRLIDLTRLDSLTKLSLDLKTTIEEDKMLLTQQEKILKDQTTLFIDLEKSLSRSKIANKILIVGIIALSIYKVGK